MAEFSAVAAPRKPSKLIRLAASAPRRMMAGGQKTAGLIHCMGKKRI